MFNLKLCGQIRILIIFLATNKVNFTNMLEVTRSGLTTEYNTKYTSSSKVYKL